MKRGRRRRARKVAGRHSLAVSNPVPVRSRRVIMVMEIQSDAPITVLRDTAEMGLYILASRRYHGARAPIVFLQVNNKHK